MKRGWEIKKLGDTCIFENGDRGKNYPSKLVRTDTGIPFINAGHLTENGLDYNKMDYIPRDRFNILGNGKVKKGDILFCLRGSLGKFAYIDCLDEGAIASSLVILRPQRKLLSGFLLAYLKSKLCSDLIKFHGNGAAQPNLSATNLKQFEIPIPPLAEQDKIVAILDEAFAAIDQAKENLEKNIQNAKDLFQSELNAIFSQKGEGWVEKSLKSITSKIGSGATPRGGNEAYQISGLSFIRSMNVHDQGFRDRNIAFLDDSQAIKLSIVTVEKNDLLLNITGASVARVCIVPDHILPARVNQHVSIVRIKDNLIAPKLLHYILTSKKSKDRLLRIGEQGSTRQAITKMQLENFEISYPPTHDEQEKTIAKLDIIRFRSQELEVIYRSKLSCLENLKKSILNKAFSGELTVSQVETAP